MANKSPAYRWYPKDILGSLRVASMTAAEECWYRRALDFAWLNQGLPADPVKLSRIIGKKCTASGARLVLTMFDPSPDNPEVFINERQEIERQKQKEWSAKSSQGGKKSKPPEKQPESKTEPPLEVNTEPKVNIPFADCRNSSGEEFQELATQGGDAANGSDPIQDQIWKSGVALITRSGLNDKNARSFLGAMAKEYGKLKLAECLAVTLAANPPDPQKYLVAVLQDRVGANNKAKLQVGKSEDPPAKVQCKKCLDTGEITQKPRNAKYEWELASVPCPNCKPMEKAA